MRFLLFLLPFLQTSCSDETISGFVDPSATYRLTDIAGASFEALATVSFPDPGTAKGHGPCNTWAAKQSAPYPWIELGPIAATRRACQDMASEQVFFEILTQITLAEVQGEVLLLTHEDGRILTFVKYP